METANKLVCSKENYYTENGYKYKIKTTISLDDDCHNNMCDVWEFDNGRATACGCGTDCYSHWSVRAESIMSVIKRSDNGKSAEAYDIDELKNNWNHWVRTGEILFTPGNGRW